MSIDRFHELLKVGGLDTKEYQLQGVAWCLENELKESLYNIKGGLVADEMGLGKTIMMIGIMYANMLKRTLIVLPPILIDQWAKEIYKISGHRAVKYHGLNKKKIGVEDLMKARIVLTSYHGVAISKKNRVLGVLHQISWSRVIFDEAHHIRNRNTAIFLGCKNIRAEIRWLVTGTPIQNNKQDFYSLCNLIGLPASFYTEQSNAANIRKHFILYRTKKDVGIRLPEMIESYCLVPWNNSKEQRFAEEIHSVLKITNVSFERRGEYANYLADGEKGVVLTAMLRAKQSCTMPSLMIKPILKLIKNGILSREYIDGLTSGSKLDTVISTIIGRKNNKGKIVFCHFHEEIDYIYRQLTKQGLFVLTLDGRNIGKSRQKILESKADILILQIQTGCEGLNLQENYSEVYFVTPHWNPALEDQAIARCHRIGQHNRVEVFKFEMSGFEGQTISLDKYIHQIQDKKRIISQEVLC
jgi:SNF2 family DNA or RNA helicase